MHNICFSNHWWYQITISAWITHIIFYLSQFCVLCEQLFRHFLAFRLWHFIIHVLVLMLHHIFGAPLHVDEQSVRSAYILNLHLCCLQQGSSTHGKIWRLCWAWLIVFWIDKKTVVILTVINYCHLLHLWYHSISNLLCEHHLQGLICRLIWVSWLHPGYDQAPVQM